MRTDKKVALVTGSSSGIGLGIARQLGAAGFDVMLHGLLDLEEGQALANEFTDQYQVRSAFSNADLRDPNEVGALVRQCIDQLGAVDVLVNNAGIQFTERLENFPEQKWHDIIAINLSSAFFAMQAAIPLMREKGWGRIINIASVHGLVASAQKSAYCAAKHGVVGLTKVAAMENADAGITVNAICPGWVETDLVKPQIQAIADQQSLGYEQARAELVGQKQALREMTQPAMLGALAVFLCSDDAATMTGTALPVDGAWTAQ
ncbi:3-hydroxybutyrate dehydrogenase [Pseudoteredinibacter isoporae]|uniref:3-hydroxybutyrate dehydrogenase n=1 Tax=Pseudoteredinibacter isoporae TaxID=570281 RepID=A0A7X0MYV9_9GAMM|nr:3-hydroxybutyrate dehydrogenase [Pseudoteredinibacter isoporae]MBB6522482.1 3-hydroxybutyrate dehydrogenase [Pseudoteredinibacter isoporae]NHO88012.1 SDR family NAD(P)-dependent oxidoreductase [Pseudoteredinibacter isoporae]NIB23657.1 3-hydroxybutyrate dehydrogenase [Pseudoteredinibacter isoporae]